MEGLNVFEQAVLDKLLNGDHPVLVVLRAQAERARLSSREYTGSGFFCSFDVPQDVPVVATDPDFHFGDVDAIVDGLEYGAGFALFVRRGRLDTLEGYSYEEAWPTEIRNFRLTYQTEPRSLSLPGSYPNCGNSTLTAILPILSGRTNPMKSRVSLLDELLSAVRPIEEIARDLAEYEWDSSEELVTLDREHVVTMIKNFVEGRYSADMVRAWAETIEGRDDIGIEVNSSKALKQVIFELANPEINGPLTRLRAQKLLQEIRL